MSCPVQVKGKDGKTYTDISDKYGKYSVAVTGGASTGERLKIPVLPGMSLIAGKQVAEGAGICHDSITLLPFTIPLEAPLIAKVVSPLTTLVSHAESTLEKQSSDAQKLIKAALGIDDGLNILEYDTIAGLYKNDAKATNILLKTAQVLNIVNQGQALFDNSDNIAEGIFQNFVKELNKWYLSTTSDASRRRMLQSSAFNLASASFVSQLYKDTATDAGLTPTDSSSVEAIEAVSQTLANTNTVLSNAVGTSGVDILQEVAKVDIILQTEVKSQVSKLVAGTIDTETFKTSTSTQVVKNKAVATSVPVNVDAYLKSAVDGEEDVKEEKKGGSSGDSDVIIIVVVVVAVVVIGMVALFFVTKSRKERQSQLVGDSSAEVLDSVVTTKAKPSKCCWSWDGDEVVAPKSEAGTSRQAGASAEVEITALTIDSGFASGRPKVATLLDDPE